MTVPTLESPCVDICKLDKARQVCIGCGRTRQEIARWTRMDDSEKAETLRAAAKRRAAMG